jgi:hypothetical protein
MACLDDQSLPLGGIMTLGYYYGIPGTNAGEHLCGVSHGYFSCPPRVPIRCRKPFGPNTLKRFIQPTWRGGIWGASVLTTPRHPRGVFMCITWSQCACIALPMASRDTPLPPQTSSLGPGNSWGVSTHNRTCHLSQGVRHRAEGCVTPGWLLAGVANNPLRVKGSTPLYLCLPPVWGSVGGDY